MFLRAALLSLTVWHLAARTNAQTNCPNNGDVRLVGGSVPSEGRVEVCKNNLWGTVTDDWWGYRDAIVVCRQLGYAGFDTAARSYRNAYFGQGTGPIQYDRIACAGTEQRLVDCSKQNPQNSDTHAEDAGVKCWPTGTCTHGAIRLVNGTYSDEGRVEVCINGVWGTVTSDWWNVPDAKVACRQLGYTDKFAVNVKQAAYGQNLDLPILLDTVQCTGSEARLADCQFDPLTTEDSHAEDAGLICFNENLPGAICNLGDIRLVGGSVQNQGRVEVCINGTWGGICADGAWGPLDAQVACRQLGYSATGPIIRADNTYGKGTGPVWMRVLLCAGTEENIIECNHRTDVLNSPCDNHAMETAIECRVGGDCTDGDVRVVGGADDYQGRVEVCLNGVWGTVCHDMWDINDARVVCRQLGRSTDDAHVIAVDDAYFGAGWNVPIAIDDLGCTGSETSLLNCSYDHNVNDCNHNHDASVVCSSTPPCTNGDIRLVNGSNAMEGRVEYCSHGFWGTICSSFWDTRDAKVACRQLGYGTNYVVPHVGAYFGAGKGAIFLKSLGCNGNQPKLINCPSSTLTSNCDHSMDASVQCLTQAQCTSNYQVRLANGGSDSSLGQVWGRVEACWNGVWGTIADDGWGKRDCAVVCNQLGYYNGFGYARNNAYYGQGNGPIHFDNVYCTGSEASLANCPFVGKDASEDFHSEDAGCVCFQTNQCTNGDIRLNNVMDGGRAGRVEVCLDTLWGTITQDNWGRYESNVTCRQLGYPTDYTISYDHANFGQGIIPILIDDLRCQGTELTLTSCPYDTVTWEDSHAEDAGVKCFPTSSYNGNVCNLGQVRLQNGPNSMSGRVEVCVDNQWGTVCDKWWNNADANIVCGQLGFASKDAVARSGATYGQGTGPIIMNNVACNSQDTELLKCNFDGNTKDCQHNRDAGVICQPRVCTDGAIRLTGGSVPQEGRVEVCVGGRWGTVCDDQFGYPDAVVACKQAGFGNTTVTAYKFAQFGAGSDSIVLDDLRCTGNENSLFDCPYDANTGDCNHNEDAGIRCVAGTECTSGTVRLVGGPNVRAGRVELCYQGIWGTLTDDSWGTRDAKVICSMLGFFPGLAIARYNAYYGQGSGAIHLDNIRCIGNEASILDCPASRDTGTDGHFEDAGVTCYPADAANPSTCVGGSIRLRNGPTNREGRVEVCINNQWGTVADDGWSHTDALVACRQAGFAATGSVRRTNAYYGAGTGPIYMDNVGCNGRESSLFDCSLDANAAEDNHNEDAGVFCWPKDGCSPEGALRLRGGYTDGTTYQGCADTDYEGRVEVCYGGAWGTISSDNWGNKDAKVICRQLGYNPTYGVARKNSYFGAGSGPITFDNVNCLGTEQNLLDCKFLGLDPSEDGHPKDAGVICRPIMESCGVEGDLRLVNGNSTSGPVGRVELCRNGVWGTVTDDGWGRADGNVVCRQLNYFANYSQTYPNARYGQGSGPIQIDFVRCTGTENRLVDCTYGTNICPDSHAEDASVKCFQTGVCTDGDIQLMDGSNDLEGRVEVCRGSVWGTVTDDNWGVQEARVLCGQLGPYRTDLAFAYDHANFGSTDIPIHYDNFLCTGSESNLLDCPYSADASGDYHSEDAGVRCFSPGTPVGDVRLVGGPDELSGRVEVNIGDEWGTVCNKGWNLNDANLVCKKLEFAAVEAQAVTAQQMNYGVGTGAIFMNNVGCTRRDTEFIFCNFDATTKDCTHTRDAGVVCKPRECNDGDSRILDGSVAGEGRVEYCQGGRWGTVCDGNWGPPEAAVVCRQNGFSTDAVFAFHDSHFGGGTDKSVWLANVRCSGNESSLMDCTYNLVGSGSCSTHTRDAGVRCLAGTLCTHGAVRLVNGSSDGKSGRVEVCLNGLWGTVTDDGWGNWDSNLVCRQLGFFGNYSIPWRNAYYGQGSGLILMDNIRCIGSDTRLVDCLFNNDTSWDTHAEDAGVKCFSPTDSTCGECTTGSIRVVNPNNSSPYEGRVEVCVDSCWGTVTSRGWYFADARTACRHLGFASINPIARINAYYGRGNGPIWMDGVGCNGREDSLFKCWANGRTAGVTHATDAGVKCFPKDPTCVNQGDLRLVGGMTEHEGRLEVCWGGAWGTISGDGWSLPDTLVACRQLGYNDTFALVLQNAAFGQGTGPIALDNVNCLGNETNITMCVFLGLNTTEDTHAKDASIKCFPLPVEQPLSSSAVGGLVGVVVLAVIAALVVVVVINGVLFWRRRTKYQEDKTGLVAAASFPRDTAAMDTLSSQVTNPLYFDPGEAEQAGAEPTISINYPEKDD